MKKLASCIIFVTALILISVTLSAQKYKPKSIVFEGANGYTNAELMTAAGLAQGELIDATAMSAHSKALIDTGIYSDVSYTFDGETLKIKLVPSQNVYPVRYGNLPIPITEKLLGEIRERAPLYRGRLAPEGTTVDGVKQAIAAEFAAMGAYVKVSVAPYSDPDLHMISAMQVRISSPSVVVGDLHIEGISSEFVDDFKKVVARLHGAIYSTQSSAQKLQDAIELFYTDRGYAAVKADVHQAEKPVFGATNIEVPFSIMVDEGKFYRLGQIHLADGIPVTQAELDKALMLKPGDLTRGTNLRSVWQMISNKYKSNGYLLNKVNTKVVTHEDTGIADYLVDVVPGDQFLTGDVVFEGFTDDVTGQMLATYKLKPGMPADFIYINNFILLYLNKDPMQRSRFVNSHISYTMNTDPVTHIVNVNYKFEN